MNRLIDEKPPQKPIEIWLLYRLPVIVSSYISKMFAFYCLNFFSLFKWWNMNLIELKEKNVRDDLKCQIIKK
jgi:hypothetical protein